MKQVLTVTMVLCLALSGTGFAKSGEILYKAWIGLDGINDSMDSLVNHARYPNEPTEIQMITAYEMADRGIDNWGAEMSGYIVPPETGEYTFWIASDDSSELWLSPDTDPAPSVRIAWMSGWTNWRDFTGRSGGGDQENKQSAPQVLEGGKKYYMMARYADGAGGGFCSVAWAGPGISGPFVDGTAAIVAGPHIYSDPWGLARATNPSPADGIAEIDPTEDLTASWELPVIAASGPIVRWDVYAGTDPSVGDPNAAMAPIAQVAGDELQVTIPAAMLDFNTVYYWRVDTIVDTSRPATDPNNAVGDLWSFRTLLTMPVINSQPATSLVFAGENATFSVTAEGHPLGGELRYQWHFNGNAIPGATDATLVIANASLGDEGSYYCVVSNDVGNTTSSTVSVTIKRLLAWYEMDDAATADDPNVVDSSGNNYHGQILGTVTSTDGLVGNALDFQGGYVRTPVLAPQMGIDGNKQRSVSAWVKTRGFGNGGIFDVGHRDGQRNFSLRTLDDTDNRWRIQYWGGDYDFTTTGAGNGKNVGSYEAPTKDTWAHFVHTHDGRWTRIYLNGRHIVNFERPNGINTGDNFTFRIGRYGPDHEGHNFNGVIDDVRVYNYALSHEEIAFLYTDVIPGDSVCVGNPPLDLNGNCVVDLNDVIIFLGQWLECNIVPDCKP